jgi:hypothetical protein
MDYKSRALSLDQPVRCDLEVVFQLATGLLDGRPVFDSRQRKIFLFSIASKLTLGPTQLPIQWVAGVLSSGVKRQGRKADHSPPLSTEIKNGRTVSPLLHMFSWHSD